MQHGSQPMANPISTVAFFVLFVVFFNEDLCMRHFVYFILDMYFVYYVSDICISMIL